MKLRSVIFAFLMLPNLLCAMEMEGVTQEDAIVIVEARLHDNSSETILAFRESEYLIAPGMNISAVRAAMLTNGCNLDFCSIINCPAENIFRITCRIRPPRDEDATILPAAIEHTIDVPHNGEHTEPLHILDKENQNSPWLDLLLIVNNRIQQ